MTDLLASFANPETMRALSTSDKLLAGLVTTLLGMGITFTALIILQFVTSAMEKILHRRSKPEPTPVPTSPPADKIPQTDDNELIAVISAVLATQLGTTPDKIIVRNIIPVRDTSPAWNKAGIIEQMNSRF